MSLLRRRRTPGAGVPLDPAQHASLVELGHIANNARWWGEHALAFFARYEFVMRTATFEQTTLREHRSMVAAALLNLLWVFPDASQRMVVAMAAVELRCHASTDLNAAVSRSRDVVRNLEAIAAEHDATLLPRTAGYMTASLMYPFASGTKRSSFS